VHGLLGRRGTGSSFGAAAGAVPVVMSLLFSMQRHSEALTDPRFRHACKR
jgi:hypothetical protein